MYGKEEERKEDKKLRLVEGLNSPCPGPARNAPHLICPSLSDCAAWCPPSSSSDGWAGLGCLPGAPHGRSPWKYPLRPGTRSRTESCGGHVSDCWRQLLSACQPRGKASWTRTRQVSFFNQPESWGPPGDNTKQVKEQEFII